MKDIITLSTSLVFLAAALLFFAGTLIQTVYGEEGLKCLLYSDGTFALVSTNYVHNCDDDSSATISWLLQKGYHIDAVVPDQTGLSHSYGLVYLSR